MPEVAPQGLADSVLFKIERQPIRGTVWILMCGVSLLCYQLCDCGASRSKRFCRLAMDGAVLAKGRDGPAREVADGFHTGNGRSIVRTGRYW